MNNRIKISRTIVFLWGSLLIIRLFYWQIVKAQELSTAGDNQRRLVMSTQSLRGKIISSDGIVLAQNKLDYKVSINPSKFSWNSELENLLKSELDKLESSESARRSLQFARDNHQLVNVDLTSQMSSDQVTNLKKGSPVGLIFSDLPSRWYPGGPLYGYVTGFVGKDEVGEPVGYFGIEGKYDRGLSGDSGRLSRQLDGRGRPIIDNKEVNIPEVAGIDIQTSIDSTVQYIAQKELEKGLKKFDASSGTVTVLDSKTAKVIAMVSLPSYDPNKYFQAETSALKNPIVSDSYEPGSTFKSVIMASAIDAGVVSSGTICNICGGPVVISTKRIGSWDDNYYPNSTMTDVILHSDNVGMVFVSRQLGREKMLDYIQKFGFGHLTGIDVQEESTQPLKSDSQWRELDVATSAFGQGIAVTPIQMITAFNAIATRGMLIPPTINKSVNLSGSRVISETAALAVTQMMVNGVNIGAVKIYKPRGYAIAGKTGTAQIPIEGYYDKTKVITSFIGFAPADDPKFTMLVTLREPKNGLWGSTTAAPIWMEIAKNLFRYYDLPASNN